MVLLLPALSKPASGAQRIFVCSVAEAVPVRLRSTPYNSDKQGFGRTGAKYRPQLLLLHLQALLGPEYIRHSGIYS